MARPKIQGVVTPAEVAGIIARLGGARATARAVGCSHQAILQYLKGAVGIPRAFVVRLHQAEFDARLKGFMDQSSGPQTPIK